MPTHHIFSQSQDLEFASLELPSDFQGLEGVIAADLRAIVSVLSQQADSRLMLTKREQTLLQSRLWNQLAGVINETMAPFSLENR